MNLTRFSKRALSILIAGFALAKPCDSATRNCADFLELLNEQIPKRTPTEMFEELNRMESELMTRLLFPKDDEHLVGSIDVVQNSTKILQRFLNENGYKTSLHYRPWPGIQDILDKFGIKGWPFLVIETFPLEFQAEIDRALAGARVPIIAKNPRKAVHEAFVDKPLVFIYDPADNALKHGVSGSFDNRNRIAVSKEVFFDPFEHKLIVDHEVDHFLALQDRILGTGTRKDHVSYRYLGGKDSNIQGYEKYVSIEEISAQKISLQRAIQEYERELKMSDELNPRLIMLQERINHLAFKVEEVAQEHIENLDLILKSLKEDPDFIKRIKFIEDGDGVMTARFRFSKNGKIIESDVALIGKFDRSKAPEYKGSLPREGLLQGLHEYLHESLVYSERELKLNEAVIANRKLSPPLPQLDLMSELMAGFGRSSKNVISNKIEQNLRSSYLIGFDLRLFHPQVLGSFLALKQMDLGPTIELQRLESLNLLYRRGYSASFHRAILSENPKEIRNAHTILRAMSNKNQKEVQSWILSLMSHDRSLGGISQSEWQRCVFNR